MLLICYPRCTTCKKAQKFLEEKGIEYQYRDIKVDNPNKEELREWHKKSGLPLKRFFNTSGKLYRENNMKDKLPNMTEEEEIEILSQDGMMVKRPILVDGDKVLVGFKEEEWSNIN